MLRGEKPKRGRGVTLCYQNYDVKVQSYQYSSRSYQRISWPIFCRVFGSDLVALGLRVAVVGFCRSLPRTSADRLGKCFPRQYPRWHDKLVAWQVPITLSRAALVSRIGQAITASAVLDSAFWPTGPVV